LPRAGGAVLLRAVALREEAGGLDHEVDLEVAPRQIRWIPLRQDLQLGLAGGDDTVADLDVLAQLPEDGVELEQVTHRLCVAEVVDRDDLEIPAPLEVSPKEVAPNAPESVDSHACRSHAASLNEPSSPRDWHK